MLLYRQTRREPLGLTILRVELFSQDLIDMPLAVVVSRRFCHPFLGGEEQQRTRCPVVAENRRILQ